MFVVWQGLTRKSNGLSLPQYGHERITSPMRLCNTRLRNNGDVHPLHYFGGDMVESFAVTVTRESLPFRRINAQNSS